MDPVALATRIRALLAEHPHASVEIRARVADAIPLVVELGMPQGVVIATPAFREDLDLALETGVEVCDATLARRERPSGHVIVVEDGDARVKRRR